MSAVTPTLKVAALQTDIAWLDREANYQTIRNLLADTQADLIVLPETFATGFAFELAECGEAPMADSVSFMQELAKDKNAAVCGSVATLVDGKKANRLYFVTPAGEVSYYDKRHLFRMGNEQDHVVAGKERVIVNYRGFRILLQVCYDLRFPVFQRNRNDYDLMINVANWPAARRHPWDTLLKARAMENLCYVVGVNRIGQDGRGTEHSGGTAIIDFKGEPLAKADDNQQQVIISELSLTDLQAFKQAFPAHLDGDDFQLSL